MSVEEVQTSYSGLKISQDEANSLMGVQSDTPVEQEGDEPTQDLGSQETDQSEEPKVVQSNDLEEISELELDGNTYDIDTIQEALEAFKNKAEWQKSNTEKAQSISTERKAFDAERAAWSGLKDNDDAMEALRDVLDEDHPIFTDKPQVDMATEDTSQDTEEPNRLQELEEKLSKLEEQNLRAEADQQVTADLNQLKQTHPELDSPELMDNVIKTAVDKGFTGYKGLEDAFVLTYHSSAENSAFKSAVDRARSAKAMKSIPETEGRVKGQHTEPITKAKDYKAARQDALKNYNFYE